MPTIFVTGSRGHTGSVLIENLVSEVESGAEMRIVAGVTATPKQNRKFDHVETRVCNYGNEQQLYQALEGVDAAYLMVPFGRDMIEWGRQFVAAAMIHKVKFIVRLSGLGASVDSLSAMGRLHGTIDEIVRDSGIDYCVLRCNSFMQNFTGMYRQMVMRGKLALAHGDAKISFIDTSDIAAVAAKALANPDFYSGKTLDLHGPQRLSNKDVVDVIGRITDSEIENIILSAERVRESYRRAKFGAWEQDVFCSLDRYFRDGYAEGDPAQLEQALGRGAMDFETFAELNKSIWM